MAINSRGCKAKGQDLDPPAETPPPRRSPRRPGKPTTVSNQKRVLLKLDDSLQRREWMKTLWYTLRKRDSHRSHQQTKTVGKDTTAPEPSTQNFEQILSLKSSTPEFDAILRKKYCPVMHSTPPGGQSRSLFDLDGWNDLDQSPEPESMSVASSDGPPSGSNDIEPQDESDGDEPMHVSDGVSLYSSKASSKPRSENEKPLGRKRFSFGDPMSDKAKQQLKCHFAAIRVDYIAAGPPPACLGACNRVPGPSFS